jgi:hypothetical protein
VHEPPPARLAWGWIRPPQAGWASSLFFLVDLTHFLDDKNFSTFFYFFYIFLKFFL